MAETADTSRATDLTNHTNLASQGVSPDAMPITPHASADQGGPWRAIRVAGAGNVQMITAAGNTRVLAFADGETRYIACTRILAVSTTATGIEGMK